MQSLKDCIFYFMDYAVLLLLSFGCVTHLYCNNNTQQLAQPAY